MSKTTLSKNRKATLKEVKKLNSISKNWLCDTGWLLQDDFFGLEFYKSNSGKFEFEKIAHKSEIE